MIIKTDYSKSFSYARMQNGIPAVRSIVLKNNGKEPLKEIRLGISFDPVFSEGYESIITELPTKDKAVLDNIRERYTSLH